VRAVLRKVGRGIREVLLFPFRLIWWILRGVGRGLAGVSDDVADGIRNLSGGD
jgi:hypothetical protein